MCACGQEGGGGLCERTLLNAVLAFGTSTAGDAGDALIVVVLGGSALLGVAALCKRYPRQHIMFRLELGSVTK